MLRYLQIHEQKAKKGVKSDYTIIGKNGLLWIFLIQPTQQETNQVISDFGLDRHPFEKYEKENHSVRYALDPFEFVIFDYFVENGSIGSARLLFIIKDNLLVMVANKNSKFYHELFENVSTRIEKNTAKNKSTARILHTFLQEDIEENYDVIQKLEEEISRLQDKAANYETTQVASVQEIVKLKRKIFKMSRRFWASTKIIFLLKAGFTNVKIDAETSKMLVDVHDTFLHQIDIATAQKEMLSDVMNIYSTGINNRLASISNDLNHIMKQLSSFALILLIPTLIASIYGMNFANIPLQDNAYGFHILLISMAAIVSFLFYIFRRKNWL